MARYLELISKNRKFLKMNKFKVFVVDDDPWYVQVLEYFLSKHSDYELVRFTTAKDCLANLYQNPDLITLDYGLPDGTGIEVLQKIKQYNKHIPVIVISAQDDIKVAVNILKAGASDYFVKDDNIKDLLWNAIARIREHSSLQQEVAYLREELGQKFDLDHLRMGKGAAIQKVFSAVEKAAKTNINVSISGEKGSGQEMVAKSIHYNSERSKAPFVAVNINSIPKELLEQELFGFRIDGPHGVSERRKGKFEQANGGTIFLDEVADLDINMQSKLLSVMNDRAYTSSINNELVQLDVRIITATDKNLVEETKKGNVREDFYYSIIGLPIVLPPLRERGDDILIVAKYYLDEFCSKNKLANITLMQDAKEKLMAYHYPGNSYEMKAIMELAAVMCSDNQITAKDLTFNLESLNNQMLNEEKTLKEYTNDIIAAFLRKYDNNVTKVSEKLDIGRSTIYKMIQDKEIKL